MQNIVLNTYPSAVVRHVGETKPAARWEVSKSLSKYEIVRNLFEKNIEILDKAHKDIRKKFPKMFE